MRNCVRDAQRFIADWRMQIGSAKRFQSSILPKVGKTMERNQIEPIRKSNFIVRRPSPQETQRSSILLLLGHFKALQTDE